MKGLPASKKNKVAAQSSPKRPVKEPQEIMFAVAVVKRQKHCQLLKILDPDSQNILGDPEWEPNRSHSTTGEFGYFGGSKMWQHTFAEV